MVQVLRAYATAAGDDAYGNPVATLARMAGCNGTVAHDACVRAARLGYIDYTMSPRSGWITARGRDLLKTTR